MELRRFDETDKALTIDLYINVYNSAPWHDEWTIDSATRSIESLCSGPSFIGYVAYIENKLVGVALGRKKVWWKGDEVLIEEFFIDRDYQSKGIGSTMLSYIQSDLRKQNIYTLTLLTTELAYDFYIKNDFVELSPLKFLYKNFK